MGILQRQADFDEKMRIARKEKNISYQVIDIDLSIARNDLQYHIGGDFLYLFESDSNDDVLNVRLNSQKNTQVPLKEQMGFEKTPFWSFWVSNVATAGRSIKIIVGFMTGDLIGFIDNRANISSDLDAMTALLTLIDASNSEILSNSKPPSNFVLGGKKAVGTVSVNLLTQGTQSMLISVQADVANVGAIYVSNNSVTTITNATWQLSPGQLIIIPTRNKTVSAIATVPAENVYAVRMDQ